MSRLSLSSLVVVLLFLGDVWLAYAVMVLLWLSVDGTNAAGGFAGSGLLAMPDEVLEVLYSGHLSRLADEISCNSFDVVCREESSFKVMTNERAE